MREKNYLLKKELLTVLLFVLAIIGFSFTWIFEERTEISITLAVVSLCLFVLGMIILLDVIEMIKIRKEYFVSFKYASSSKSVYEFFSLFNFQIKYGVENSCGVSCFEREGYYYCYLSVNLFKMSFITGDLRKVKQGALVQFLNEKDLKEFYNYLMSFAEERKQDQVADFNYIDFEKEED